MKQKLSITIDEDKVVLIETLLKEGFFRSKSHVLEYSLIKMLADLTASKNNNPSNTSSNISSDIPSTIIPENSLLENSNTNQINISQIQTPAQLARNNLSNQNILSNQNNIEVNKNDTNKI